MVNINNISIIELQVEPNVPLSHSVPGVELYSTVLYCTLCVCVCVCVCFLPIYLSSLDVPAGVTQDFSSTLPSFCGAGLNFSREKDSAIPFLRRPLSRILCTINNDLL